MDEIKIASVIKGELQGAQDNSLIVSWWSFTKTVLATCVLALVRDGKLELDVPFKDKPYTIRQFLQHTSGLPDYGNLEEYQAAISHGDSPWSIPDLLKKASTERLLFEPGTRFVYSNIGYLFIKQIVEETTHLEIRAAFNDLVFKPLNIDDVRLAQTPGDLEGVCGESEHNYNPGWVYHGLLVGRLGSAATLLNKVMETDFLPKSLKDAMLMPHLIAKEFPGRPFQDPSYGLGIMEGRSESGWCVGHTGQGPTSTIAVYHFPKISPVQTIAAFVENGDPSQQGTLERRAAEIAASAAI